MEGIEMRLLLCIAGVVLFFAGAAVGGDGNEYYIRVSVKITDESGRVSRGSGGFATSEMTHGLVSFTLYRNVCNFKISSSGATAIPANRLSEKESPRAGVDDIELMLDYYLLPRVTADRQIRITGVVQQMERARGCRPASFLYAEHPIDITIPNRGSHPLEFTSETASKNLEIELYAEATTELVFEPEVYRAVSLHFLYSLINEDDDRVEVDRAACRLGMPIDGRPGSGSCSHRKIFNLPDGNILVYYSIQTVENPRWNDDSTITFDFEVLQAHALNPEDTAVSFEDIQTLQQKSETLFLKTITINPGERTVVEVPFDHSSPLPFAGRETIVIENTVTIQER